MSREDAQSPAAPVPGAAATSGAASRYDLEELQALAQKDRASDETVKVRVNQDDIRKLMQRRRTQDGA